MGFKRNAGFIDRTVLVAANGETLELHGANRRYVLTEEDYGIPPVEYVAQRGIFQDGETVLAQYLRPRPVQLVVRWSACSRAEYWNNRSTLLEFVRPARSGSGSTLALRKYLANGAVRQLNVVPDASPTFGPRNMSQWDEFAFSEAIKFIAHDPTWFNPTQKIVTNAATAVCTHAGTWKAFPVIRVTGAVTDPVITNTATGETLTFTGLTVASGTVLLIDLTYGNKSATVGGSSALGNLDATSDLATFHLAPSPEALGGANSITLSGSGTDGNTLIDVRWYDRFIGI